MKKLFAALAPVLFLFACSDPKEAFQSKMSDFLQKQLDDPSSYQPASFSYDTVLVFTPESPEYRRMMDDFAKEKSIDPKTMARFEKDQADKGYLKPASDDETGLGDIQEEDIYRFAGEAVAALLNKDSKEAERFAEVTATVLAFRVWYAANGKLYKVPLKLTGYKVRHAFRSKNQYGALVKQSAVFYIDAEGNVEKIEGPL